MHGLLNRSIQGFLRRTYGEAVWHDVAARAGLGPDGFEAMLDYDDNLTDRVINAAALRLDRPRDALLEDLGTYLVSHPDLERLRRLLRFGGTGFVDFLHSLDELPDRARMALPELELPELDLNEQRPDRFRLMCKSPLIGAGHVILGLLRAMADDYGSLAVLEHEGSWPEGEIIRIDLLDPRFSEGRRFDLAGVA